MKIKITGPLNTFSRSVRLELTDYMFLGGGTPPQ